MPDQRGLAEEKANIVRVLLKDQDYQKDLARFGQAVEKLRQQNRAAVDSMEAAFSTIDLSSNQLRTKEVGQTLKRFDALIAANIPRVPVFASSPLIGPALKRQMSQITSTFASRNSILKDFADVSERLSQVFRPQIRDIIRSIQIALPAPNSLVSDILGAMDGDASAAERVALRITWRPDRWQRDCIRLKSRVDGVSLEEVRQNALVQGVFWPLAGKKRARFQF